MGLQVEPEHYLFKKYVSKKRFCSYWHQIDEIMSLNPKKTLEIGIRGGLVSNYLKYSGLDIVTMDIDERLKPDYVGSVLSMPFSDKQFEVVAAFEVLEHLPYDNFCRALREIYRVSSKSAIISLPDATKVCPLYTKIPKIREVRFLIPIPLFLYNVSEHKFDGEHYWEIGKKGYSLKRIIGDIKNARFKVIKSYRVFENPYHRFFVLRKMKS